MPFTRMYTGRDGQSHIEEMDQATHPTLQELESATGISFGIAEPGHFIDWHTAPRRQYVITLSGEGEIGLGDGSVHKFGPGHVSLVEDLTARDIRPGFPAVFPSRVSATVRLENQNTAS